MGELLFPEIKDSKVLAYIPSFNDSVYQVSLGLPT